MNRRVPCDWCEDVPEWKAVCQKCHGGDLLVPVVEPKNLPERHPWLLLALLAVATFLWMWIRGGK